MSMFFFEKALYDALENENIVMELELDDEGNIHAYATGEDTCVILPKPEDNAIRVEIPLTQTETSLLSEAYGKELKEHSIEKE